MKIKAILLTLSLSIFLNQCAMEENGELPPPIFSVQLPRLTSPHESLQYTDQFEHFHFEIQKYIRSIIKDPSAHKIVDEALQEMAESDPVGAQVYWQLNDKRIISVGKTVRDQARTLSFKGDDLNKDGISMRLFSANLALGYLRSFKPLLDRELLQKAQHEHHAPYTAKLACNANTSPDA